MTVQQLRKEVKEIKDEAVKTHNLWICNKLQDETEALTVKEEIIKEIAELKVKMQYYIDGGVFDNEEGEEEQESGLNMNWESDDIPTLTPNLIQSWKNRNNLTLEALPSFFKSLLFLK